MKLPGTLDVLLVSAQGIDKTDDLTKVDHAILTCSHHQEKSKHVAKGPNPIWNESFTFHIHHRVEELKIKLIHSDASGHHEEFVGEVIIHLGPVFEEGKIPPDWYKVIKYKDQNGYLKVGVTFTPHCQ